MARESVYPQSIPGEKDDYQILGYREAPWFTFPQLNDIGLQFGQSLFKPWNSSYWPTYKGIAAHRYSDPNSPESDDWYTNLGYYRSNPPQYLVSGGQVDRLAPSEKYDLLIGDPAWGLTEAMWARGQKVANTYGRVPKWFGFCHGWNGATHMGIPEPLYPVKVLSADGLHSITFEPADIKALISWLWAESPPSSLFIGQRCKSGADRDELGRVIDPACYDNNPMTWHLAVINRVGRDKESFVMDVEAKSEVWNYSVDSYYFRYFNPSTLKPLRYVEEAVVRKDSLVADQFAAHRAPNTVFIVGVMMQVFHPKAIVPRRGPSTGEREYDSKTFIYDLELDADMKIIGGEWHSADRPDFVWAFPYNSIAQTRQDGMIQTTWTAGTPLPNDWVEPGRAASNSGKALAKIVTHLLELSRINPETAEALPAASFVGR